LGIIAATNPATPSAPWTTAVGSNIVVSWDPSYNGGSPNTGYIIRI